MFSERQTIIYSLVGISTALLMGVIWFVYIENTDAREKLTSIASFAIGEIETTDIAPEPIHYIQIINSCGPHFEGDCVNVRASPSTTSPSVYKLRNDIVLKISEKIDTDDGSWYKINFDEWLRYPERVRSDWYVSADFAFPIVGDYGEENISADDKATTTKYIIIDRSDQAIYAYDGDSLFMETSVSTGLDFTPTPRGEFTIYRKTPSRYMQGPLPGISDQYYDLPGVSWNLYFTHQGGAIHGTYWHDSFGQKWSHGCVNLPLADAHRLYDWAPVGTKVFVRD